MNDTQCYRTNAAESRPVFGSRQPPIRTLNTSCPCCVIFRPLTRSRSTRAFWLWYRRSPQPAPARCQQQAFGERSLV
jgi:hypothetical protein